jgi:hypothetical protein
MTRVDATNQEGWVIQCMGVGTGGWAYSFTKIQDDGSETPVVFETKKEADESLTKSLKFLHKEYEYRVYPFLKDAK